MSKLKIWQIEEVEYRIPHSQAETDCEKHFAATHTKDLEGRFVVRLPLKENIAQLGESYEIAAKRLKALERKLERQPNLKHEYHAFMSEYLKLNHISEVPASSLNMKPSYYMPHHAVVKK